MGMEANLSLSPNPLSRFPFSGFSRPYQSCLNFHAKSKLFASSNYSIPSKRVKEFNFVQFDNDTTIPLCPDGLRAGEELSGESYNRLIRRCCSEGNVDKAMSLLAKLDALGFHPSFVSYAYLIEALGSVGRTLEADCLFQEMRGFGFKPRTKLYNVLLRGCLKKGMCR